MRYLIASDLHGALSSAEKIVELDKKYDFEKILLLGDINYHGPRNDLPLDYAPKKVIPLLNGLAKKIIAVRGNCDAEVDQMVYDFDLLSAIKDYRLLDHRVILTHGHIYHEDDFDLDEKAIFMYGHTHIPVLEKKKQLILNPGSLSLPKGGHQKTYALLDEKGVRIMNMDDEEYLSYDF